MLVSGRLLVLLLVLAFDLLGTNACDHDASVCVPPFGHLVEFHPGCSDSNPPDDGLGCHALGYECCRYCGHEHFADCVTVDINSEHEFYVEMIQADEGSGGHCAESDIVGIVEQGVVYHAQNFFESNDVSLIDQDIAVSTEDSAPGEEVQVDPGGTEAIYVAGFELIDANANTPIGPLNDGDVLYLDDLPSLLTVEAELVPAVVGCVKFEINERPYQEENNPPYVLNGDSNTGNYFDEPELHIPGTKTIRATPYSDRRRTGIEYPFFEISITVKTGSSPARHLRRIGSSSHGGASTDSKQRPARRGRRSLYSSYWYSKSSYYGRMRCSYCSFANNDADHFRQRQLQDTTEVHHNVHSEFEAYMSHFLTRDVREYLTEHGLSCMGTIGEVELFYAQAS